MRDSQRSKVYYAECEAMPYFDDEMSIGVVEKTCLDIINSEFVKDLIENLYCCTPPSENLEITGGDKRFLYAQCNNEFMCFPKGTRNMATICHELSHCLTIDDSQNPKYAYHGREFCYVYLTLVKEFMSQSDYNSLKREFSKNGVDWELSIK